MAQHDYNLTNQAGAAFRSDLNDALAAILSSNSGPTAPTTTAAGMWWYDTTNALLKRRNSTDSGWITICAIDSPLSYFSTTQRLVGRNTAGGGVGEEVSLSQLLDWIGSPAQGDILFRGASGWSKLAAGTAGQFLKTQGAGAAPIWDSVADNNGLNLIYGGTVSGTPTVIPLRNLFNDTGYYDIVVIIDTLAYLSGTPTLQMRVSVDGSTDDTSSSYGMVFTTKDHSGVSVDYNTGRIEFTAPDTLGSYNIRIYDDIDQETAAVTFTVISDEGKEATLQLNQKSFEQNEQILVYFEVPSSFSHSAWVGMLSTKTPHGVWQDSYGCISYGILKRHTAGVIDFTAPSTPGSYDLRLYDSTYGQEAASVTFTVILDEEKKPSLWLDKTSFNPGEQIEVHFTAPSSFKSTAWVGIVPSEMSANEYKYDFPYKPLNRMTAGVLTFAAPVTPGSYDVRMNDVGENNGQDVASITFTVESN